MLWVFGVYPKPMSRRLLLLTVVLIGFCYILLGIDGVEGLEKESKSKSPKALFVDTYFEDWLFEAND